MRTIIFVLILLGNLNIFANEISPTSKASVMALNYMHFSLNKIILHNDKRVLEEEYEDILNNINLTSIHDEEIISIMKKLMDTLTLTKLTEKEKNFLNQKYEQALENAITVALTQGTNGASRMSNGDSLAIGLQLVSSSLAGYKQMQSLQQDKELYALDKKVIQDLNEIRKEFLTTYWKIMKKYSIPDNWRISEKQFKRYINVLKGDDDKKKFRQLVRMKNDMRAFPHFWYELSLVAHKLEKVDDELQAVVEYEKLDDRLLRENSFYSLMLVNQISLYNYKIQKPVINRLLKKVAKVDSLNPERKLFMGMKYLQLGNTRKAEQLFNENLDDNFLPILSQKLKLNIYIKENSNKNYQETLNDLIRRQNLSAGDYLIYLAKKPLPFLAKEVEKQVKNIQIFLDSSFYGRDNIDVWLPKKWVLKNIKDVELHLILDGKNSSADLSIEDNFLLFHYSSVIYKKDLLQKKIKSFFLEFMHQGVSINIEYKVLSTSEYKKVSNEHLNDGSYWDKIKNSTSNMISKTQEKYQEYNSEFKFIPARIFVQDKCFDLQNSLKACQYN